MKSILRGVLCLIIIILLAACGSDKSINGDEEQAIDDIYTHLEKTVEIESPFKDNQIEIHDLEKEDDKLYNEITEMGKADQEQLIELAQEAIILLDKRFDLLNEEKAILTESKQEIEKIETLMDELEDIEKITQMNKIYDTMMKRYEAYDIVYDSYQKSLSFTRELYLLVQEEVYNEGEMFDLVNKINESYDEILEANEIFNEQTNTYNELKKNFYDYLNEQNELE